MTVSPPLTVPYRGDILVKYGVIAISYVTEAPPSVDKSYSEKSSPSIVTPQLWLSSSLSKPIVPMKFTSPILSHPPSYAL